MSYKVTWGKVMHALAVGRASCPVRVAPRAIGPIRPIGPIFPLTHHASRITHHAIRNTSSLRTLYRRLHRRFRHDAQRLARIILITAQLDPAHTVRARFDSERRNGRVRAERAARESFP